MILKRFHSVFSSAVVLLLITACNPPENKPVGFDASIRVTDFRGKEIALQSPAKRIVCLIESGLSGLYMLHAEENVVGVPSSVYYESAAPQYALLDSRIKNKQLPAPGNWDFVNIESLVALQPDLVIMWSSQQESIAAIEEKGIPVYGVFLKSFADVYKEIKDFGILTGTTSRADSIISYTRNEISTISQKSSNKNPQTVYFIWPQGVLETSGTTSTVNELIELAGAKNACQQPQEHLVINKENLLEWDPDIILLWNTAGKITDNLLRMSEVQNMKAIKEQKVYELPPVFWCDLWTLKFQFAVKLLAKNCNPSAFENLNLQTEKQKMIDALYGKKGQALLK